LYKPWFPFWHSASRLPHFNIRQHVALNFK
jgi:hypothetical protein